MEIKRRKRKFTGSPSWRKDKNGKGATTLSISGSYNVLERVAGFSAEQEISFSHACFHLMEEALIARGI